MDREAAFKQVERNRDYMVDILRRIIAVDTSVPPGQGYGEMIDVLEPEMAALGFSCERVEVPEEKVGLISSELAGPRLNLVARLKNDRPPVSVYAHMDVVPVGDTPWTHDPFGGEIEGGKLYGRGAVDMKGSIAAFLGAVKALKDLGIEPIFDLQALFCTDEEVGIQPGSRHLAEAGYFSPHIVWLEIAAVEPLVVTQTAGAARFELTGVGKSCHSGANYMGVNAIEEMVPVMNELLALKKIVEQRESETPALPLPGCPFRFMTPMFNLNVIRGGTKDNIVPGECTLTVNRRFIPEESFADTSTEIFTAIQRGLKRSKLCDHSFFSLLLYPPARIDPDTQAARRARAAARIVKGHQDFTFGGFSASTDLGFVLAALSPWPTEVAAFSLWRINEPVAHAADEYVHLEDLLNMAKELVLYFGDETLEKT